MLSVPPFWNRLVCLSFCAVLVAACTFPGSVKPTVKVGLSAPFEGQYRDLGYEVLYAVRLAIRERNEDGGIANRYLVEFVALNDLAEAQLALIQAQKMAVDSGVMGVLGGLAPAVARAAAPEYERMGLAFLYPNTDFTKTEPTSVDATFAADYQALSGGAPPGLAAVWAYEEANRLLDAVQTVVEHEGDPNRRGVRVLLGAW